MITAALLKRARIPFSGLLFLGLRCLSAVGALINGFALTYGLARVLEPSRLALFMWVANFGVSLWLFDLGLSRVLYRRIRAHHLSNPTNAGPRLQIQATGLIIVYMGLVVTGAALTLAISSPSKPGTSLALFFAFCALNLPWHALRQVAAAVDCFVIFESLEAARRLIHISLLVALPMGLPLNACLLVGNAVWLILLVAASALLGQRGGLAAASISRISREFLRFLTDNCRELLWSASYIGGELYIYTYPPLVVPIFYGLGQTAIAFDTAYKVFRSTNVLLAAACEVATPWQTRAHEAGDHAKLRISTAAAAAISFIPAAAVCCVLFSVGDTLFSFLLGHAAHVPHTLIPLVAALVFANWLQTVANNLLLYNGYFRAIGRLALAMAVLLSLPLLYETLWRPGIVGFMTAYTVIYFGGALAYFALALFQPLRRTVTTH